MVVQDFVIVAYLNGQAGYKMSRCVCQVICSVRAVRQSTSAYRRFKFSSKSFWYCHVFCISGFLQWRRQNALCDIILGGLYILFSAKMGQEICQKRSRHLRWNVRLFIILSTTFFVPKLQKTSENKRFFAYFVTPQSTTFLVIWSRLFWRFATTFLATCFNAFDNMSQLFWPEMTGALPLTFNCFVPYSVWFVVFSDSFHDCIRIGELAFI